MLKTIHTTRDNIKVFNDAKRKLLAEVDTVNADKRKTLDKINNTLSIARAHKSVPVVLMGQKKEGLKKNSHRNVGILDADEQQLTLKRNINLLREMHVNFATDLTYSNGYN
ncbi:hypothetical protein DPMN_143319 [Dreissena polymorpha]|uniref:Uncharacterized protein n=1 Tax=Dreissena polymorpha TaxID=45954 RepID=A0A9D4JJK4_DREPO|nr:hypothetical protein DPMN_143319 [Dreissena polymorpha]